MTARTGPPDILGTPNLGPLFAPREDAPAPPLHRTTVHASGGSSLALSRVGPALTGLRGRVYAGIHTYGPVTRETLAVTLAMKKDTVNGRASELLAAGLVRVTGYDRATGQGLLAVTTTDSPSED